jgi:hypothetical protein
MAVVQPAHFKPDCTRGDWHGWVIAFGPPFRSAPVTLLTATDLGVSPFSADNGLQYHNAAAVGVVKKTSSTGFQPWARNADCAEGDCAFAYVALSSDGAGGDGLVVETGEVALGVLAADCHHGDWQSNDVTFSRPFLTPPVVLATANDHAEWGFHAGAVVPIAQNVNPYGFRLAGRSADCAGASVGCYWVAIGCGPGCG